MSKVETRNDLTVTTYKIPLASGGSVDLVVEERGKGRPFLLLHGGAGPASVSRFASLMAERKTARIITPTHPGFARTGRPDELKTVKGLAQVYASLLDQLDLDDVIVIGNSIGGWIASEMALLGTSRVGGIVLVDAVGVDVPNHPVTNISILNLDEVMRLSYHDPTPFRIDPSIMTDVQRSAIAANRATLLVYAPSNTDPSLNGRLAAIKVPVLVIWGDSDRIVDPDYGRAFAAAIPNAKFLLINGAGHFPQVETPEKLLDAVWKFSEDKA